MTTEPQPTKSLSWKAALFHSLFAVACFHAAYSSEKGRLLMLGFFGGLFCLRELPTKRQAFYWGLGIGLALYAPQLHFFWTIFSAGAIALWLVLAFWIGLFLVLAHCAHHRLPNWQVLLLLPVLWTGLEYFRSELYYLRFSWMNPGYAASGASPAEIPGMWGTYGTGFVLAAAVALFMILRPVNSRHPLFFLYLLAYVGIGLLILKKDSSPKIDVTRPRADLHVAGVQMEFPAASEVVPALDKLAKDYPGTELFVLSEYTFQDAVPKELLDWCRTQKRHLIVGGKEFVTPETFYNTAFVVGPEGTIVFKQAKSVPIQFFKDGLPATSQAVWNSPWGKIGLCVCYDFSYRRVTDELVRLGAQAIIVPTMDVSDWGTHQHELHGRIGPMRAAEYQIPIFRVCSSGISQLIASGGTVTASAPFPGEGKSLGGTMVLWNPGRLPWDHWLAPACTGLTALFLLWLPFSARRRLKAASVK